MNPELPINDELDRVLARQRSAFMADPVPGVAQRRQDLRSLRRFLHEQGDDLCRAVSEDFGHRSAHETRLLELAPLIGGIDHALRHLERWMRPQRRPVQTLAFGLARNRVVPQPIGVVGVIVPWNFPLFLSLGPLTSVLAAGNRAMLKMSENSRALTRLMMERMPDYLASDKLAIFEETGGVGQAFSALRFDHLMFTGSGNTARAVMAAAARNLCPVTLELGGKSPAVIAEDYPLQKAVERIMWVKCLNAGQICTTVDHVWLPEGAQAAFAAHARSFVEARYGRLDSTDYTSIIDTRSFERLRAAVEQAVAQGATVQALLPGEPFDPVRRRIAPMLVFNAPPGCALMQREIFGPILPVLGYRHLDDVVAAINAGPRPLALYPFSHDRALLRSLLARVLSGGVTINDALFHVAQHDLPFGGIGESGMGHYHGREGFETFSKMRPVFEQARLSPLRLMWPPYGRLADRLLNYLLR